MNNKLKQSINVGVDTGKTQLDIHIRPLDIFFSVENTDKGIKEALKVINKYSPERIVIEATGRLEMPFVLACAEANLPIVRANPVHIKRFAGAIGRRAKNDRLDAELIAHYGEAIKPQLTIIKAENIRLMSDLVIRRNQLLSMQTMEKNRIQVLPKNLHSTIKPMLTAMKNQITKIESKLVKLIENSPEYQAKNTILQSVPGIGNIAAASIISNVPELGYITNKQAASLIGVAPITRESGRYKGKRVIQGGRTQVRTVLYMAMMSAMQCNPRIQGHLHKTCSSRKTQKGRYHCMCSQDGSDLNTMLRDGVMWDGNIAKN